MLKNWRPVSLLNVDYKMLSSALSMRLSSIMGRIISPTQGCAVKGRYIFDNLRLIEDLLSREEYENKYQGGIIKTLDLEKAFDRVEHGYISDLLKKINIGPVFNQWIELLYTNISTQIQTSYGLTNKINVTRSVRQGCPLSMALFVLTSEPLMRMINGNDGIKGIQIQDEIYLKICAYADDTTLFLKNHQEEMIAEKIIQVYGEASGAKCNQEKTGTLYFGEFSRKNKLTNQGDIDILGLKFNTNKQSRALTNWGMVNGKIKSILNKWRNRHMSIIGKGTIVNAFVISLVSHVARIMPPPRTYIRDIEKSINNFLIGARPILYSNRQIIRPSWDGGFGLPDFSSKNIALQLMWIHYFKTCTTTHPWRILFRQMGGNLINKFEVTENMRSPPHKNIDNTTYTYYTKPWNKTIKWDNVNFGEIYKIIVAEKYEKYSLEKVLKSVDWAGIWVSWSNRQISNKYKVLTHTAMTDHFNKNKYKNKSGNCPMCDYGFVQSRDHSFFKCKGAVALLKYIKTKYGLSLQANCLFYEKYDDFNYKVATAYIATIIKLTNTWVGKWGKPGENTIIKRFKEIMDKI